MKMARLFLLALVSSTFGFTTMLRADAVPLGAGRQPQIATDGSVVYVTFGRDKEILVAKSVDGGKTFSPATVAAKVAGMPLGMRRGPRIATVDNTVVLTAIESPLGGGKDGDLFAWTSTDGGATWAKSAKPLNRTPAAAREGLHTLASDGKSQLAVAWLDLRHAGETNRGTEVWVATSNDAGKTWTPDRVAYARPSGSVCECCHPSVAFDGKGKLWVMFRNSVDGARDMYWTHSDDGGKTFVAPVKLGSGTWKLNACPMDGGALANVSGKMTAIYRRAGNVFMYFEGGEETEIADGSQPVLCANGSELPIAWINGGNMIVGFQETKMPALYTRRGDFPAIAATPNGAVIAAWELEGKVTVEQLVAPKKP